MINHPANALVVSACIALIALAFWFTTLGIKALGDYQSGRMFRRLGHAAAQKAAEESGLEEAHREFLANATQDGDQP